MRYPIAGMKSHRMGTTAALDGSRSPGVYLDGILWYHTSWQSSEGKGAST
jgi:hypothetical protein